MHFALLLFFLLLGGVIAIYLGKDTGWDVAAYHFYNPYALLHKRWDTDYWPPAIIQAYLNPTLDLFSYFVIRSFEASSVQLIFGSLHAINFCLLFYISSYFFHDRYRFYKAFGLTILGLTAPNFFAGIGSIEGDNTISIFVLAAVLVQLYALRSYETKKVFPLYWMIAIGFFLGVGTGLKLTCGLYVLGFCLSLILLPVSLLNRAKSLTLLIVSFGAAFVSTAGYWMLFLWHRYHNPVFPLLNGFFHAAGFPFVNWADTRHFPHSIWEKIFFPFYFSWNGSTTDLQPFIDYRLAITYVLFAAASGLYLYSHLKIKFKENTDILRTWLILFFVCSYLSWQVSFSIMRYFAAGQLLSPLIIYLLLELLIENRYARYIVGLYLMLFIIVTSSLPIKPERTRPIGKDFFAFRTPPSVEENKGLVLTAFPSLILLSPNPYPYPENYLIPFLPTSWKFVGIPFIKSKPLPLTAEIITRIKKHHGPIYLLGNNHTLDGLQRVAKELNLQERMDCQKIVSDIEKDGALLCRIM